MSTDYNLACQTCRMTMHLGQRFTTGWTFGHGTGDTEAMLAQGQFIQAHAGHELRVRLADLVPGEFLYLSAAPCLHFETIGNSNSSTGISCEGCGKEMRFGEADELRATNEKEKP